MAPSRHPHRTVPTVRIDPTDHPSDQILLTRLTPGGGWATLAEAPSEIRTKGGAILTIAQVVVPKGDTWLLLSGCAATAQGSGVVVRVFEGKALSEPRFVPFQRP